MTLSLMELPLSGKMVFVLINSSPPGQDGRHFGRQHFQTHFREWKY